MIDCMFLCYEEINEKGPAVVAELIASSEAKVLFVCENHDAEKVANVIGQGDVVIDGNVDRSILIDYWERRRSADLLVVVVDFFSKIEHILGEFTSPAPVISAHNFFFHFWDGEVSYPYL